MRIKKETLKILPNHVAIIMDGNGTWAKKRGLPRNFGHKRGAKTLLDILYYANEIGIKYLTVFAFSTENWKRPKEEVDYLMNLPIEFIEDNEERLNKDQIRVKIIGSKDKIPENLKTRMVDVEEKTKTNTGLTFLIAFNYGSHDEILRAVNAAINDGKTNLTEEQFANYLDTKDIPPVDFLIRTSGQVRISNFLLWQIAYSELYFTKTLWPDFNIHEFNKALIEYQNRDRRYGGIK